MAAPSLIDNKVQYFDIGNTLLPAIATHEDELETMLSTMGAAPSSIDLLNYQMKWQQMSTCIDLTATLTKSLSESVKGVVQKMG